ncbi:HAD family hydrolase [Kitasatospora purpeofusca]|uniref:Haloacid dehalogenase-like hydrolase n=1 Tax=Kitasatospora purpeofusca TaxID=67352 RepID=A0ABZ1U8E4_9ACTN|nr:haloacid dehalogenase-like hydrolase [Kitasatospora purpeofusca]
MKRPAALLDLDGTLHPRTLGAQMLRELLRAGASRDRAAGAALTAIDAIDGRADQSAAFLTTVDEVYVNYTATVTGLPHPMLIQAASRAWQAERHAVFDFVPVLLAELTARGFVLALISGSPQEVVEEAGSALGIPHCYGARVAVVDGHCQGRLERAPGYPGEKTRCLADLTAKVPIDLSRSVALGDSASDIEILNAVGHPVAFEPDQELSTAAHRYGWPTADRDTALRTCVNSIESTSPNPPNRHT